MTVNMQKIPKTQVFGDIDKNKEKELIKSNEEKEITSILFLNNNMKKLPKDLFKKISNQLTEIIIEENLITEFTIKQKMFNSLTELHL
jgi:hypothetical protein